MLRFCLYIITLILSLSVSTQAQKRLTAGLFIPGDTVVMMTDTTRLAGYMIYGHDDIYVSTPVAPFVFNGLSYQLDFFIYYEKSFTGAFIGPHVLVTGQSNGYDFHAIIPLVLKSKNGYVLANPCRHTYAISGAVADSCTFVPNTDECTPMLKKGMREKCHLSFGKDNNSLANALEKHLQRSYPVIGKR